MTIFLNNMSSAKTHGNDRKEWSNGEVLEGTFVKGQLHCRQGKAIVPGWGFYRGGFSYGQFEGVGEFIGEDGFEYEGEWMDGEPCGEGEGRWPNGETYKGRWWKGKAHGFGTRFESDGCSSFSGWFAFGHPAGRGRKVFPDGSEYFGDVIGNVLCGEGLYIWRESGMAWRGGWKDGVPSGEGTLAFETGHQIHGPLSRAGNTITGQGWIKWRSGSVYHGPLVNSTPHGSDGVYVSRLTGTMWVGNWDRGHLKSPAKVQWSEEHAVGVYEGPVNRDGLPHGCEGMVVLFHRGGTVAAEAKCMYRGGFVSGTPHGNYGEWRSSEGHWIGGPWRNGKPHGDQVTVKRSDGSCYIGGMVAGEASGVGQFVWGTASVPRGVFSGFWADGMPGEGPGIMIWPGGQKIAAADWNAIGANDFGVLVAPHGVGYQGGWVDGRMHGVGLWRHGPLRIRAQWKGGDVIGLPRDVHTKLLSGRGQWPIVIQVVVGDPPAVKHGDGKMLMELVGCHDLSELRNLIEKMKP